MVHVRTWRGYLYILLFQVSPKVACTSYKPRYVKRREKCAKICYCKIEQKYKAPQKSYSILQKKAENLERQNKYLTVQLTKQRALHRSTKLCNKRNLKRVHYYTSSVQSKKMKTNHLNALKCSLNAQTKKVRKLEQAVEEADDKYCQLEEKCKEACNDVSELSQTKAVTTTKEGNRYSNEIRELYYQLLA